MEWRRVLSQDAEDRGSVSMAIRIEAGEIVEVIGRNPTHNHYQRFITCTDDNELTPILSRVIHAKTREELKIIDQETKDGNKHNGQ